MYFKGKWVFLKDLEIIHLGKPQSASALIDAAGFNSSSDIQQEFIPPALRSWSLKFSLHFPACQARALFCQQPEGPVSTFIHPSVHPLHPLHPSFPNEQQRIEAALL